MDELQKRLLDLAIDGAGMYISHRIVDYIRPYTKTTLKQYNDGVIKVMLSLADLVFPQIRQIPYAGDWLGLWGRAGVDDIIKVFVDKPTDCWAEDANTVKCINFDTKSVTVKIDGTSVTPSSIDGTAEEFAIHLAVALSTGAHDLIVVGDKKAFSGKIYVR